MESRYDKEPTIPISGLDMEIWRGYHHISQVLRRSMEGKQKFVMTVECYPTTRVDEIVRGLELGLNPVKVIDVEQAAKPKDRNEAMIERYLTEDRVFGYMAPFSIADFYDQDQIKNLQSEVEAVTDGLVVVIGTGASLVTSGNLLIYADMARWEIPTAISYSRIRKLARVQPLGRHFAQI